MTLPAIWRTIIWSVDASFERSIILASHPEPGSIPQANRFLGSHLRTHFAASLCLLAVLGGGCIFSPHKDDDPPPVDPPVVYPARDTPQNAIIYLTKAWAAKDSVRIDSLYADEYTGSSIDLTESSAENLSFVKSDEVRTVGVMARSHTLVTNTMDFGLPHNWQVGSYASDPPEWQYVQIQTFTIYINDTAVEGLEYSARSPEAGNTWRFEFTLKPTYPNGPSEAPVWQIVRWLEERDETGSG